MYSVGNLTDFGVRMFPDSDLTACVFSDQQDVLRGIISGQYFVSDILVVLHDLPVGADLFS